MYSRTLHEPCYSEYAFENVHTAYRAHVAPGTSRRRNANDDACDGVTISDTRPRQNGNNN